MNNRIICLIVALFLMDGCAQYTIRPESAAFSSAINAKIHLIKQTEIPDKEKYHKIKNLVCDKDIPRVIPTYRVKFVPPHRSGLSLDKAANQLKQSYANATTTMKELFFENMLYVHDDMEYRYHSRIYGAHIISGYFEDSKCDYFPHGRNGFECEWTPWFFMIEKDGSEYPLEEYTSQDLAFLVEHYSFALPNQTLDYAVKNRDDLWFGVFKRFTTLKEAPQPDGSVNYEVSLDLTPFCQYGVAVKDLISE